MMTIHQCMCLRVRENEYALFKLLLCVLFYIKYCNYSFNNIVFKHYIYLDYALFACIYVHANSKQRQKEREGGREICDSDNLGSYTTTMWRSECHIDAYSGYYYVIKQQICQSCYVLCIPKSYLHSKHNESV